MTPGAILSSVGNSEAAHCSSLGSRPGYGSPGFVHVASRPALETALDDGLLDTLRDIRDAARARKEYATADRLRDVLAALGAASRDGRCT